MAYYFSSVLFNCTEHAEMFLISSFPAAVPFEGGIYFFFFTIKKESTCMKNSKLSLVSGDLGVYKSSRHVNYLIASSTKG